MKVLDCVAYLHWSNQLKVKFEKISMQCIFIGCCTNGYTFLCSQEKKVITCWDVIFDESFFAVKKESKYTKYNWNSEVKSLTEVEQENSQNEKRKFWWREHCGIEV